MAQIEKLLGNPIPFLEKVFRTLEENKVDVSSYELDHICYRVETPTRFLQLLDQIAKNYGTLLGTPAMIGGRPIASIKLYEPIKFKDREISVLEFPAPKKGSNYPESYEHVEFVMRESFKDFMRKYPHLNYKTNGMNKEINPELGVKFEGFSVKFHHQSLEYVVTVLEKQ